VKLTAQIGAAGITFELRLRKGLRENEEQQRSVDRAGLVLHL